MTAAEAHRGPASPAAGTDMPAALRRAEAAVRAALDAEGIELTWDDIGKAVRAAEPILRQAVAEGIARRLIEVGRDPHRNLAWMYPEQAAEIAREVGRGQ